MYKISNSKLRAMLKLVQKAAPTTNNLGKTLYSLMLGNRDIGTVTGNVLKSGFNLDEIYMDERFRGLGLGKKIYGELLKLAPNNTLMSDRSVSAQAQNVYKSMKSKPAYSVTQNPAAVPVDSSGTLATNLSAYNDKAQDAYEAGTPLFKRLLGLGKPKPIASNSVFTAKLNIPKTAVPANNSMNILNTQKQGSINMDYNNNPNNAYKTPNQAQNEVNDLLAKFAAKRPIIDPKESNLDKINKLNPFKAQPVIRPKNKPKTISPPPQGIQNDSDNNLQPTIVKKRNNNSRRQGTQVIGPKRLSMDKNIFKQANAIPNNDTAPNNNTAKSANTLKAIKANTKQADKNTGKSVQASNKENRAHEAYLKAGSQIQGQVITGNNVQGNKENRAHKAVKAGSQIQGQVITGNNVQVQDNRVGAPLNLASYTGMLAFQNRQILQKQAVIGAIGTGIARAAASPAATAIGRGVATTIGKTAPKALSPAATTIGRGAATTIGNAGKTLPNVSTASKYIPDPHNVLDDVVNTTSTGIGRTAAGKTVANAAGKTMAGGAGATVIGNGIGAAGGGVPPGIPPVGASGAAGGRFPGWLKYLLGGAGLAGAGYAAGSYTNGGDANTGNNTANSPVQDQFTAGWQNAPTYGNTQHYIDRFPSDPDTSIPVHRNPLYAEQYKRWHNLLTKKSNTSNISSVGSNPFQSAFSPNSNAKHWKQLHNLITHPPTTSDMLSFGKSLLSHRYPLPTYLSKLTGMFTPRSKPAQQTTGQNVDLSDVMRTRVVDSIIPPKATSDFMFNKAPKTAAYSTDDLLSQYVQGLEEVQSVGTGVQGGGEGDNSSLAKISAYLGPIQGSQEVPVARGPRPDIISTRTLAPARSEKKSDVLTDTANLANNDLEGLITTPQSAVMDPQGTQNVPQSTTSTVQLPDPANLAAMLAAARGATADATGHSVPRATSKASPGRSTLLNELGAASPAPRSTWTPNFSKQDIAALPTIAEVPNGLGYSSADIAKLPTIAEVPNSAPVPVKPMPVTTAANRGTPVQGQQSQQGPPVAPNIQAPAGRDFNLAKANPEVAGIMKNKSVDQFKQEQPGVQAAIRQEAQAKGTAPVLPGSGGKAAPGQDVNPNDLAYAAPQAPTPPQGSGQVGRFYGEIQRAKALMDNRRAYLERQLAKRHLDPSTRGQVTNELNQIKTTGQTNEMKRLTNMQNNTAEDYLRAGHAPATVAGWQGNGTQVNGLNVSTRGLWEQDAANALAREKGLPTAPNSNIAYTGANAKGVQGIASKTPVMGQGAGGANFVGNNAQPKPMSPMAQFNAGPKPMGAPGLPKTSPAIPAGNTVGQTPAPKLPAKAGLGMPLGVPGASTKASGYRGTAVKTSAEKQSAGQTKAANGPAFSAASAVAGNLGKAWPAVANTAKSLWQTTKNVASPVTNTASKVWNNPYFNKGLVEPASGALVGAASGAGADSIAGLAGYDTENRGLGYGALAGGLARFPGATSLLNRVGKAVPGVKNLNVGDKLRSAFTTDPGKGIVGGLTGWGDSMKSKIQSGLSVGGSAAAGIHHMAVSRGHEAALDTANEMAKRVGFENAEQALTNPVVQAVIRGKTPATGIMAGLKQVWDDMPTQTKMQLGLGAAGVVGGLGTMALTDNRALGAGMAGLGGLGIAHGLGAFNNVPLPWGKQTAQDQNVASTLPQEAPQQDPMQRAQSALQNNQLQAASG